MRKISALQILIFLCMLALSLGLAIESTAFVLRDLPLGDFRGIALALTALVLIFLYAMLAYRILLALFPLEEGELTPGSRAEFSAQMHILFYLMIFNTLVRTHFIPIPLMRLVYIGLGARLGQDTYSAGAILDPALTSIGDRTIIGHDAALYAHIVEGHRFGLYSLRIGSNVTIGAMAVIMPGVVIEDGAIVSSGAVVTKGTTIGAGEIWGGVPARKIGVRSDWNQTGSPSH